MAKRIALFVLILCSLGSQSFAADIASWRVLPEKSKIEFIASYAGAAVTGEFPSYSADIKFDPKQLDKSKVNVKIELAKVKSSYKDAEQSLPGAEWFDAKNHQIAVFETQSIEITKMAAPGCSTPTGEASACRPYIAKGQLKIRDKTVPVELAFWIGFFKGDGADAGKTFARMEGNALLKRLDFGVGQGEWASTGTVKNEVAVQVKLEAVSP